VQRPLLTVIATAALLAPLAPAHAVAGLSVDDPKGDVTIAAPKPAKFRTLARSADITEATAVIGKGKAVLSVVLRGRVEELKPSKGNNAIGVTWFVCAAGSEDPCDGTVLTANIADAADGDVDWQGTAEEMPDCPAAVKAKGRLIVLKTPRDCVRLTDGVTLSASLLARFGDPGQGGALLADDTKVSDAGSL
jgi:hypothetical protein